MEYKSIHSEDSPYLQCLRYCDKYREEVHISEDPCENTWGYGDGFKSSVSEMFQDSLVEETLPLFEEVA